MMALPDNATLLDVIHAQNEYFENLTKRVYGYNHTSFAVKDIDTVYNDIITANPELADVSAIGFVALLKDGETVSKQGKLMFINGEEETEDYTFSGENSANGNELVIVWYFETEGALEVNRMNLDILEISVRQINSTISYSADFFDYVPKVTSNVNLASANLMYVRSLKYTFGGQLSNSNTKIGTALRELESAISSAVNGGSINSASAGTLRKLKFPYLTTAGSMGGISYFTGLTTLEEIEFPNLKSVMGEGTNRAGFSNVKTVVLPESVESVGAYSFKDVANLVLNCPDAVFETNWCVNTPSTKFTMCSDWGASINIATAAANWIKADFVDLFTNKLRDFSIAENQKDNTPDSNGFYRKLTIPSAKLAELEADTSENGGAAALTIAETKLWDVVGG